LTPPHIGFLKKGFSDFGQAKLRGFKKGFEALKNSFERL